MDVNEAMKTISAAMKANGAGADEIAKMEIAIQYFCNPEFKEKLNDYVFNATYNSEKQHQSGAPLTT